MKTTLPMLQPTCTNTWRMGDGAFIPAGTLNLVKSFSATTRILMTMNMSSSGGTNWNRNTGLENKKERKLLRADG
jgi:hypothetical protein